MTRIASIALVPAAIAAMLLAAPAAAATSQPASTAPASQPSSTSGSSVASTAPAADKKAASTAQNHTQGNVDVECLREDPRKPPDPACSKLASKRHPKEKSSSAHAEQGGDAGR